MTEFKLTPTRFSISEDTAYLYDKSMKFSTPHTIVDVIMEAQKEMNEQHPFTKHLEEMPLLKGMFFDYLDEVEDMETDLDKIRRGTATPATYKALQDGTESRLTHRAFLAEQFSFYQKATGNEAGLTFDEIEEIVKDYRNTLDGALSSLIDRKIYKYGA